MIRPETIALVACAAWAGCASQMANGVHFADFDGSRIAYELFGDGPPTIVFVHGWGGDRSHWHHQTAGVSGRLMAVDLLGHGDSDRPEGDYSFPTLARGVAAAMDDAGIERAVLVGHSNGALVGRAFYREFPERTLALVIVDSQLRSTLAPGVVAWMRQTLASPDFDGVARMLAEQTPRGALSDADYELIKRGTLTTPQHVHEGGLAAMTDPEVWREDPIEVPLMTVMAQSPQLGDYEPFIRKLAPGVGYHVWEGASHALHMERAEEFNALLSGFVARHSLR